MSVNVLELRRCVNGWSCMHMYRKEKKGVEPEEGEISYYMVCV